jgi:hypothetical protein
MPKVSEDKMAILFVAAVYIWTFVALPAIYLSTTGNPLFDFWHWATHDAVAAFTGILAISTIGLWTVTSLGIRAQAQDTRVLQRAYISVDPAGIHYMRDDRSKCVAHIEIRNSGNLPASKVKWNIREAFDKNPNRTHFGLNESKARGNNTLPPKREMRQGGGTILDLKTDNRLFLYVWGAVYYEDGFENKRVTRFCHRYTCALVPKPSEIPAPDNVVIKGEFARQHRDGNEAD